MYSFLVYLHLHHLHLHWYCLFVKIQRNCMFTSCQRILHITNDTITNLCLSLSVFLDASKATSCNPSSFNISNIHPESINTCDRYSNFNTSILYKDLTRPPHRSITKSYLRDVLNHFNNNNKIPETALDEVSRLRVTLISSNISASLSLPMDTVDKSSLKKTTTIL